MWDLNRLRRSNRGLRTHAARRKMYPFVPSFVPSFKSDRRPVWAGGVAVFVTSFIYIFIYSLIKKTGSRTFAQNNT